MLGLDRGRTGRVSPIDQHVAMADEPSTRSVKIGEDERTGWSSERPRRDGAPRQVDISTRCKVLRPSDISVRCRVLAPSDHLRYSPTSLLVIVSPSPAERDRFAERMISNRAALLSLGKVRALLAGRVPDDELAGRAQEILDAAVLKRLQAGETVVLAAEGMEAEERERYARMAASSKRPRHLLLLEAAREDVQEEDRAALNELRRRLDAGELGAEGFQTAVRIGGGSVHELKRILFQHPPREE
jgi:predicted kinase